VTTRLHKLILVLGVALAVGFAVPAAAGTSERAKGAVAPHTAGRPTEEAFISRADAICRRSDDKEAPLIYQAGGDLGGAGPKLLVVLRAKHRALRLLRTPAGFDPIWNMLLGKMKANIDRFARNVERAKTGRSAREDTSTPLGRLTDAFRAHGFKWCP